ncbi:MAG: BLUF domain-containing protein [Pseudomonadota bacterium]
MLLNAVSTAHPDRVFRLSYASRPTQALRRAAAVELADEAAANNAPEEVSGVLFSEPGLFLQWLEGPAAKVCDVMARIAADPRHTNVTILNAGWIPDRRYPDWAMQLADSAPSGALMDWPARPENAVNPHRSSFFKAFDAVSAQYHRTRYHAEEFPPLVEFVRRLIRCSVAESPPLPKVAQSNLHARAQFIDDVCAQLYSGWQQDLWNSVEVTLAMAHLNLLWQRLGRVPEPMHPRQTVAVVVPPGSTEILGTVVKADLLRAAKIAVHVVKPTSPADALAVLAEQRLDAIIVAGSRVGWDDTQTQTARLVELIQKRFPSIPAYLGGQRACALDGWPERIASLRDNATALQQSNIHWPALSLLSSTGGR